MSADLTQIHFCMQIKGRKGVCIPAGMLAVMHGTLAVMYGMLTVMRGILIGHLHESPMCTYNRRCSLVGGVEKKEAMKLSLKSEQLRELEYCVEGREQNESPEGL